MDINYELKRLRDTKKQILASRNNLRESQEQELAEAKSKIEKKYNILIESNNIDLINIKNRIYYQCKVIEQYSKFNLKDISNILASLISTYESESFIVIDLSYKIKGALFNDALFIINMKKLEYLTSKVEIKNKHINSLIKNGFIVKLVTSFSKSQFPTEISFYTADSKGGINQNVNFGCFEYAKYFIDYLINYRIENNLNEISFSELEMLKNKFICCNLNQIKEYHESLDEAKRIKFEEALDHDRQVRNRKLQKILKSQK